MEQCPDLLHELVRRTFELSVGDAGVIPAQSIVVEERFVEMGLLRVMESGEGWES